MPSYSVILNDMTQDDQNYVWASGQDLRRFTGSTWEYYNFTNSAVPSGLPYFLDTRSLDMDPYGNVWSGVAQGPTAGLNEVAVFYIDSKDVTSGDRWDFSDLGTFNEPQEISLVYACPFGDDVYAFSTPLNGIGGTGTTGYTQIRGVTGGRLFTYYKQIDTWYEVSPGFQWPHVYDMAAKGYDGITYFYYVGTSEGLFVIPQGRLETVTLLGGEQVIKQGEIYTTSTSGILSNYIYSLDLDEDGNLWIGTDRGLSFFNGKEFYNYPIQGGPVTKVQSRPNGHVFYTIGDGELNQGSGIWHFNGTTHTNYNTSNSELNNNNVLDFELITHNIKQQNITVFENSLWALTMSGLSAMNYDQPHVYGSSKYAGATGWNFTYFSPTGGTAAPLPKVNKYTWDYPEWQVYQTEYLAQEFPGLDPRNLFLTTSLEAIADGRAGKQPYWNNWPIPTYDQELESEKIQLPLWSYGITAGIYSGTTGSVNITCSTSIETKDGIKYYLGGYLKGSVSATVGYYNDSTPAVLNSSNPTIGGASATGASGSSSFDSGETGFIICYGEGGYVDAILPIRGYSTRVQSLSHSSDENFLYASGSYNRFVESGPYVWDSLETENALRGGPTGAPAGVTNSNVPGLTSGTYPWIYGSTGALLATSWIYNQGSSGSGSGDLDVSFSEPQQNWEYVSNIYLNYVDSTSTNRIGDLSPVVTSNVISLFSGSGSTGYFRIDGINTLPSAAGLGLNVTWQSGATGSFVANSTTLNTDFYEYLIQSYPLVRNTISRAQYWNTNNVVANGFWVAKIDRDLGDDFSFANLGLTGGFGYDVRTNFRVVNFRAFPARFQQDAPAGDQKNSKVDVTDYSVNLGLESTVYFYGSTGGNGELATLTGLWERTSDYSGIPDYFLGSTTQISQNWNSDSLIGYLRLSTDNFGLMAASTSSSIFPGTGASSSNKSISSIQSLSTDNTTLITGSSEKSFDFAGIGLTGGSLGNCPFFYIIGKDGVGVTGNFLSGTTGAQINPMSSKNNSTYFVTHVFGGSGTFFGRDYESTATGAHFYTAQITEQGVSTDLFVDYLDLDFDKVTPVFTSPTYVDNFFLSFRNSGTGSTAAKTGLVKSNRDGKILDYKYFTLDFYNPLTTNYNFTTFVDPSDNIFIGSFNYGVTGEGFYGINPNTGKVALSQQYVPELGINLGNIISRPGSGAWTWCDVHSTDKGMQIPLMSTVVFNNYASNIYGKQNNVWILSEALSEQEILNVKSTPYFIYTFTQTGNFTIYNKVEDSVGNVYSITKPGYIEVIDHKVKRPEDRNPDLVDSFDYGVPEAFAGRDFEVKKLGKSLLEQQGEILKDNSIPFGVEIKIPDNPDATFRDLNP